MSSAIPTDPALRVLASRAMLVRLDAMAGRIDGVRRADDVEHVHQMRVASRRLRAALREFAPEFPAPSVKAWTRAVRAVTRRLGEARDLDVQILFVEERLAEGHDERAVPGLRRLLLRLRQRRERRQRAVVRAMDDLAASGLFDDLGSVLRSVLSQARLDGTADRSEIVHERARAAVRSRLESLLAYESFVNQPERNAELHRMRIEAKRLRYTLELFAPAYDGALDDSIHAVKRIQTLLGDLHDLDVWIEWLPRFLRRERRRVEEFQGSARGIARIRTGIDLLTAEVVARRADVYGRFRDRWRELDAERAWERMLAATLSPTPDADPADNVRSIRGGTDARGGRS